ncbi:alcohol dehydrogenase [Rhizobium rhizosphaerae]|uniref:enoyl-[acyl-carrier-protein] reductase n=1 Tax=Xaviernesmea rhizosphaerae TaxID=1672749 RepID=A0A1Q9ADS6_9HYPH|nr:zinc-binding dehydrogenase [Xaviernesmea rhizosphaerae]OLP53068.1 alcohol dehydrogenase [Xaviernesmea rhizosphaerae]
MRSAVHDRFGDPQDVLGLHESPQPVPGTGEVLVRMHLSPIHNHDLWTVRGSYGIKPPLPAIGGSEAVGVVEAVGPEADASLIGRRVAAAGLRGSWAEYFVAPARALVPLPDAISDEAGAQLIAMPFSALSLLEFLEVQPGDWIVQNTANGAVGKVLAMVAAARGIHTVNLVRRDEGVAELESLGIANAVSTAGESWKDKVRALTGEAGARAGVDSIGGKASGDIAELLGDNGLFVSFGSMTGEPMQISSGPVIFKQLTIKGFWGSKVSAAMAPEDRARLMGELIRLVVAGQIILPVDSVFPLEAIGDAVRASLAPGKGGKVLLRP